MRKTTNCVVQGSCLLFLALARASQYQNTMAEPRFYPLPPYPRRSSRRSARTISSTPIARSPPAPAGWTASGFKAKKNSRRAPAAPASVWTDPEVGVRIRHGEFIRRNCSLVVCFALSALPQRGHSDLAFIGAVEGEQVGRYDRRKQRNIDRQVNVIFRR